NHPECTSSLVDMDEGTAFHEILDDTSDVRKANEHIDRLIFCSGKVFYDLDKHRTEADLNNAAIIRIEQMYPWYAAKIKEIASRYPNASKWVWCQEEPLNMGAWSFVWSRLEKIAGHRVRYAGRVSAASPSTGSKAIHKREQKDLVERAFNV
ncbi:MAG: 2-oxoglutarate dehydrogenase E1 component, partial [Verrucomicrobiales bacterium]|nr:2-oxoglutarate dehydrogenase E1 component [Verrucomicrobiales bacterium]